MRKNKRYSANELVDFINLYLINGISYKDLNENYRLNLNSAKFNFYVRKYKENGPTVNITPEIAHKAGKELADNYLKGDHQYIITTHLDTDHIHNHIVFNQVRLSDLKMFDTTRKNTIDKLRAKMTRYLRNLVYIFQMKNHMKIKYIMLIIGS